VEAFARWRGRHVVVQTALENDVVCVVDPAALRQILLNLLDNAVKYGPRPDGDDHARRERPCGSWSTTRAWRSGGQRQQPGPASAT
jgi:signal transduction histidine kinase